jgi:hypothetical protein
MVRGARNLPISFLAFLLAFFIGAGSLPLRAQALEKGNLIGFVYDQGGKTPVEGAVVVVKNTSTGAVYKAAPTNKQGMFTIQGLGKGIYSFGITTPQGDFNGNELIGILANETAKIAVSLNAYEGQVRSAVQVVLKEQQEQEGEARVGRVVGYNPNTKEADVFVERGLLQLDDSIRVRGGVTDFYQDVKSLKISGISVRRALAGQNVFLKAAQAADIGDIVYVVCKRGVPPIFWVPWGTAVVTLGTLGLIELIEKECVSPFKKK